MNTETRSRAYREGWQGRRTYKCRQCQNKFSVDTLAPLTEPERICPVCKKDNSIAVMVANDVGNWDSFRGGK